MEQIQKLSLLIDSSQAHIEYLQKLTILSLKTYINMVGGKINTDHTLSYINKEINLNISILWISKLYISIICEYRKK